MRFIELEPKFFKVDNSKGNTSLRHVDTIEEADGVRYLCPKCFEQKRNHAHSVICYKPGVELSYDAGPGRWPMTGTGFEDLTLTPSVQLLGGCGWHGFVTNGEVTTC